MLHLSINKTIMSFQTIVTQKLAAITALLNGISTNAKKIDELPSQDTLDTSSRIHVSKDGISERIEVSQIITAVQNIANNKIISIGNLSVVLNVVSGLYELIIPATPNPTWIINAIYYSKNTETKIPIPFAGAGLSRIDIIYLDAYSQIVRLAGTETAGIAVQQNTPINTIYLTQVYVTDSTVGNPTYPDILPKLIVHVGQSIIFKVAPRALNELEIGDVVKRIVENELIEGIYLGSDEFLLSSYDIFTSQEL